MMVELNGAPTVLLVGDVIEVTSLDGAERHNGPLQMYSGKLYVGRAGRTVDYYLDHGYSVRLVSKYRADLPTVAKVVQFVRETLSPVTADVIEARFGGES